MNNNFCRIKSGDFKWYEKEENYMNIYKTYFQDRKTDHGEIRYKNGNKNRF